MLSRQNEGYYVYIYVLRFIEGPSALSGIIEYRPRICHQTYPKIEVLSQMVKNCLFNTVIHCVWPKLLMWNLVKTL